jgi:hypothetical protein
MNSLTEKNYESYNRRQVSNDMKERQKRGGAVKRKQIKGDGCQPMAIQAHYLTEIL